MYLIKDFGSASSPSFRYGPKKKVPTSKTDRDLEARRLPTLPPIGSTIGADGLNFPVRNGKGWAPPPWPPKF